MFEPIARARRDLIRAAAEMSPSDARYAVDLYYQVQDYRKATANQQRASESAQEPDSLVSWSLESFTTIENSIRSALGKYAEANRVGAWAIAQHGIGPVISAGLLAHIDITRSPTAGNLWSFAGLSPHQKWRKGQKRPWNARLKVLAWKIGDSFVKQSGAEACFYGHYYRERKAIEVARNEAGEYADIAARDLAERTFRDRATKAVYEAGRLPDGRIDLRARRWAVKLFLAHYHHVAWEVEYGTAPPRPYVLEHGGHTHYIAPPGWPMQ